jgi:hypothetical protein
MVGDHVHGVGIGKGRFISSSGTFLNCTYYVMQHKKVDVTEDLREIYGTKRKRERLDRDFQVRREEYIKLN